jgi:hypothetical protein
MATTGTATKAGTKAAARDLSAEVAFLTRALKAPTLRESVTRPWRGWVRLRRSPSCRPRWTGWTRPSLGLALVCIATWRSLTRLAASSTLPESMPRWRPSWPRQRPPRGRSDVSTGW